MLRLFLNRNVSLLKWNSPILILLLILEHCRLLEYLTGGFPCSSFYMKFSVHYFMVMPGRVHVVTVVIQCVNIHQVKKKCHVNVMATQVNYSWPVHVHA